MRKINIKDIKLQIQLPKLLNLLQSKKDFIVDIDGNIYELNDKDKDQIVVFKYEGKEISTLLDPKAVVLQLFGNDYKPSIDGNICKIELLGAWQNIIKLNKKIALYEDHHTDGIEVFFDKDIEDIGWYATPFDIAYRTMSDFIEDNCAGTFVFYENDISFSGFVVVEDKKDVYTKLFKFVSELIEKRLSSIEELDSDQEEALEFFNLKV